jgi:RNA polymerase sigma factor (sigma-70 family)
MLGELSDLCRRLAPQVLAKRGWQLIEDEAAFIEEVRVEAQARLAYARRPIDKIVEDATLNRYGHVWHTACRSAGTLYQRRALEELHRYLYSVAWHYTHGDPSVAEDCAQEALIDAWQHLDQVQDPGAFMHWASMIVYHRVVRKVNEGTQVVKNDEESIRQSREVSETDLVSQTDAPGDDELMSAYDQPAPSDPSPAMTAELRAKLEAAINQCLGGQQPAVIIGLFLDDKSAKEMADELGTTPANVWVLKSRGLQKLRECQDFLDVIEELV